MPRSGPAASWSAPAVSTRSDRWTTPPDTVTVGAGVSLENLISRLLPLGWFVAVTPGTRQVSVGGAIAADIHGKNHHRDGSFGRHVIELTVVTPGGPATVSPEVDGELFWATVGGMGLTGIVTRAVLRLIRVDTSWVVADTDRFADLDGLMAAMIASDASHRYSVGWVDCAARGRRLGRGVLTSGDHAAAADLPARLADRAGRPPRPARLRIPAPAPRGLLNAASVAAFNEVWYRRAPRHESGALRPVGDFFHPLDGVGDWNLLYGPAGFVQYQFVVGPGAAETVRRAVEAVSAARVPSFLAVLKRFGPGSPGPLSFPMEGWTLALDFPIGPPGLHSLLTRLDQLVLSAGGRVYLAKDARLHREHLASMYPRLNELAAVRHRVDPGGVFASDLACRLGLDGGTMNDALGRPSSAVVLGGTSDIARAILESCSSDRAVRRWCWPGTTGSGWPATASALRAIGASTAPTVAFDARQPGEAGAVVGQCLEACDGDVDLVLMAVGSLGEQSRDELEPDRVAEEMTVNLTWPAAALAAVAGRLREQGHGRIVVLSSVAGVTGPAGQLHLRLGQGRSRRLRHRPLRSAAWLRGAGAGRPPRLCPDPHDRRPRPGAPGRRRLGGGRRRAAGARDEPARGLGPGRAGSPVPRPSPPSPRTLAEAARMSIDDRTAARGWARTGPADGRSPHSGDRSAAAAMADG